MKTLRNNVILLLILVSGIGAANAQTKKDKKPTKEAYVKTRMDAKRYTFLANYVLPQRGGGRQLTSEYDLRVTPDSVISYLPYFGRAYFDVPYGGGDGGIKFTSTKFTYEAKEKKKGGWEISIRPSDVKNIDRLLLNISADGYASLSVNSTNRDFITFDGYLK
ncbi:MAG: hypothetical protein JWQ66_2046 [Mucilaginibacter sp.]|nr:hypothetical protein [Mucilaginibacter sp.]